MADLSASNQVSSPATTPGSLIEEEKFLVPYQVRLKSKKKLIRWTNTPFGIISISLIEIILHTCSTPNLQKALRFEPDKRFEIWRFFTYMLVHDDWYHLMLNVVIQCLFAVILEKRQGHLRVLLLYFLGGFTGVLGASCVHPDLVIGASAGVYALLISNISDIILNYTIVNYKIYRLVSIAVLVLFDIIYNIVHIYTKKEPVISWEAHIVGGIAGFLLGLIIYRRTDKRQLHLTAISKAIFWTSVFVYVFIIVSFVIVTMQIKKCTPPHIIHNKYIYFC